jgi:hypothetical protein
MRTHSITVEPAMKSGPAQRSWAQAVAVSATGRCISRGVQPCRLALSAVDVPGTFARSFGGAWCGQARDDEPRPSWFVLLRSGMLRRARLHPKQWHASMKKCSIYGTSVSSLDSVPRRWATTRFHDCKKCCRNFTVGVRIHSVTSNSAQRLTFANVKAERAWERSSSS